MAATKKKILFALSSLLLVATVVNATGNDQTFTVVKKAPSLSSQALASSKAVQAICGPTDYRETCERSLFHETNLTETDPHNLMKASLNAAVKEINGVIQKSIAFQEKLADPRLSRAQATCNKFLDLSLRDLKRSFNRFQRIENIKYLDLYLSDLKTWLSGAITYQDNCLDLFKGDISDAGEKMKDVLETSRQLAINGLAMVDQLADFLSRAEGQKGFNRRLLTSEPEIPIGYDYPTWVGTGKRRLLAKDVKADIVVAKDGSGDVKTISDAVKKVPLRSNTTFTIFIKAGVYAENVEIEYFKWNVMLVGEGSSKTRITGSRSNKGGYNTANSATLAVYGDQFVARNIGFENTAGPTALQAVALLVSSDRSIIHNCRIDGYQDTLFADAHRQFYRDCTITGTIDYIFGNAAAVFQNCKILLRTPTRDQHTCVITAHGRQTERATTGFVIQNSIITTAPEYNSATTKTSSFLGRPWKPYARTIVMNTQIDRSIDPQGWAPWPVPSFQKTCWYAEYNNKGGGADLSKRVKWPCIKKVDPQTAKSFTASKFLVGDAWIPKLGVPYVAGM